ncbi:MAG: oxaloacetate decarboxylase [Burkholderiaceae bacterium]
MSARRFQAMLGGPRPVIAPNVFNALTARLAQAAGFEALYLGGGPLGYLKCITEANLALPEMVDVGLEIRAACPLPLILDGTCGWGDPMHLHRTIALSEAAGFEAIEIEDQPMPKRAHHHIGIEHLIPIELMSAKIQEAVRARTDPAYLIIGRTNAARCADLDEALRRGEAYKRAGADMLLALPRSPDQAEYLAQHLPPPLMYMALDGGLESLPHSVDALGEMGYRFIVDPMTPVLALHKAMAATYEAIARRQADPLLHRTHAAEHEALNRSIDLDKLLAIERATVEPRA